MDFAETDEHKMLRDAVSAIARKYGHDYYVRQARAGLKTDELWDEMAADGFLGVNTPEQYGGGGQGLSELAIVGEEFAAAGCPLLMLWCPPPSAARSRPLRQRSSSSGGCPASPPASARWPSPSPSPTPAPTRTTSPPTPPATATSGLRGTKTTSPASTRPSRCWSSPVPRTDPDTGRGRLSLFLVDPRRRPRHDRHRGGDLAPGKQFTLFFDDVVVPADRLIGEEGDGLRQVFFGLNPERIMSAAIAGGIGRYALERAVAYARERRCGARPSPGTRAWRTRWPRPRSRWSWPA